MEKICIVKRRRMGLGIGVAPRLEPANQTHSEILTIELTQKQMEQVRSNGEFQNIFGMSQAPILLSLHLDTHFPMKMLKSDQICDMLQISASTLKRLVKRGAFKSHRIGRLRRFAAEDVMEYLSRGLQIKGLRSVLGTSAPRGLATTRE